MGFLHSLEEEKPKVENILTIILNGGGGPGAERTMEMACVVNEKLNETTTKLQNMLEALTGEVVQVVAPVQEKDQMIAKGSKSNSPK